MRSPVLSSSSSEIGFEAAHSDDSRSITPIPNRNRSRSSTTDSMTTDRPPARLENRHSPVSASPERRFQNKDDADSFFEV